MRLVSGNIKSVHQDTQQQQQQRNVFKNLRDGTITLQAYKYIIRMLLHSSNGFLQTRECIKRCILFFSSSPADAFLEVYIFAVHANRHSIIIKRYALQLLYDERVFEKLGCFYYASFNDANVCRSQHSPSEFSLTIISSWF